jgi:RNA polymerase sigma factor (sigma-70 family)
VYGRVRAVETGEAEQVVARVDDSITVGELEDARLGFFRALSRRYGRDLLERLGDDCFAQAAFEFSRKVDQGEEIRNPAAWITHCALNRVRDEIAAVARKPQLVPTESLISEPVAEASWQPEDIFLSEDRTQRVREAVDQLPPYQRELIARAYFEEESVREASRKMGWSEGKGARAHNAARKRLRKILGPTIDIGLPPVRVEIGWAAFLSLSAAGRSAGGHIPGGVEAALDRALHGASNGVHKALDLARHPLAPRGSADLSTVAPRPGGRISHLGRRLISSPVAETAATAGDGPGRIVEVCKVLAVCAVSGTAVTAGLITASSSQHQHRSPSTRQASQQVTARSPAHAPPVTDAVSHVKEAPTAESGAIRPRQARGTPRTVRSSVAHSIATSRTATSNAGARHREPTEEGQSSEQTASREAFSAFEGRGEAGATEGGSSAADAQSLSSATTPSPPAESAKAPTSASPKESSEKKAAAEEFQGALR